MHVFNGIYSGKVNMMALVFQRYANEPVEILKVVKMLALHDLGEIDAGDVYLYAAERDDAEAKEWDAVEGLFGDLPEGLKTEFKTLWAEFAEGRSAEARYARALDRFQPFLSNISNEGGSWKTLGISKDQVLAKNKHIADGSDALWKIYQEVVPEAEKLGFFKAHG